MSHGLSVALLSHVASARSPTGAEHSLAMLAGGLAARGHRVVVAAPAPWLPATDLEAAGARVRVVPCRVCWLAGQERVPAALGLAKWLRCHLPPTGRARLGRWLRDERPDVVHVNCLPHVHGAAAAAAAGLPVVWHVREILPPGSRRRWFAARLAAAAREIVAVSEAVGTWLRDEGLGGRLSVVPNGVRLATPLPPKRAREELGLPTEGVVAGLFGQVLPHKGAVEFVRAGRRALRDEPAMRFVIAGSGPAGFLDRVRREMQAAELPERFHLLPARPSGELLMAAADVVCLTTLVPDPLPRTVLEAMAAGKPVAAFRSGGTAEMVVDGETGVLVAPGDVEALAGVLVGLGRDPARRAEMGRAARARAAECFGIDRHVEALEAILRRAAKR